MLRAKKQQSAVTRNHAIVFQEVQELLSYSGQPSFCAYEETDILRHTPGAQIPQPTPGAQLLYVGEGRGALRLPPAPRAQQSCAFKVESLKTVRSVQSEHRVLRPPPRLLTPCTGQEEKSLNLCVQARAQRESVLPLPQVIFCSGLG